MAIVLGPHRYGKAENRIVRIVRDAPRHEIRDLNVSTALTGDFDAAHLTGDQRTVLPTELIVRDSTAIPRTDPLELIISPALGTDGR